MHRMYNFLSDCEAGENHARATDILRFFRFDEDAVRSSRQQPRKVGLAHRQRQSAEIVTGERHDVEGVQLHLVIVLAGMQRVEIGDTIDAKHHGLAVDHELLGPVLQGGLDDPWIPAGPVTGRLG